MTRIAKSPNGLFLFSHIMMRVSSRLVDIVASLNNSHRRIMPRIRARLHQSRNPFALTPSLVSRSDGGKAGASQPHSGLAPVLELGRAGRPGSYDAWPRHGTIRVADRGAGQ